MSANLQELIKYCTDTEVGFKKISETLAAYIKDTSKNVYDTFFNKSNNFFLI